MFPRALSRQITCDPDYPVVQTARGRIRGIEVEGSYEFRGIRYAESRRFRLPGQVAPWDGIRDAVAFGPVCHEEQPTIPNDAFADPHRWPRQSEDCQYLNIWTQSIKRGAAKPVMVWIHGGGWRYGSSLEQFAYNGDDLSRFGDVVVVSLNHRLNVLGYLDLSSFGDDYAFSGVAGLADLVVALEWIRDNIAAFGGDPSNVTIVGHSGGGSKVLFLLQTPSADGLYHKAVVQSGSTAYTEPPEGVSLKSFGRRLGELTVEALGLARADLPEIETMAYPRLAEAAAIAQGRIVEELGRSDFAWSRWEAVADGAFTMGTPYLVGFREETKRVPLLVSSVLGEHSSNLNLKSETDKNRWSEGKKLELIGQAFGPPAGHILSEFERAYPGRNRADLLYIDRKSRKRLLWLAKERARIGGRAWNALFALDFPHNNGTVAWHCSEIPYVFHNADYMEAAYIPGVTERLQDLMAGAWIAFAKSGDPNSPGLPEWPSAMPGSVPTMIFDREVALRVDHDAKLCELLPRLANDFARFPPKGRGDRI